MLLLVYQHRPKQIFIKDMTVFWFETWLKINWDRFHLSLSYFFFCQWKGRANWWINKPRDPGLNEIKLLGVWHFHIIEAYSWILMLWIWAPPDTCGLSIVHITWLECSPWIKDPIRFNHLLQLKVTTIIVFHSVCSTKGSNWWSRMARVKHPDHSTASPPLCYF